ncbi:hypothetical protein ACU4GR_29635 [Methylobacterium oryzae CBMB20]
MTSLPHIASLVLNRPLAILPSKLRDHRGRARRPDRARRLEA